MWRSGVVMGVVFAGGVLAANATAAPSVDHVHLRPASTSADHAPDCDVPDVAAMAAGPGAVVVTFTVLPPGC